MQPIIYNGAVSVDGYIAGPSSDIGKFAQEGQMANDYTVQFQIYSYSRTDKRQQ